jgi:hypothetical protein
MFYIRIEIGPIISSDTGLITHAGFVKDRYGEPERGGGE